MATKIKLPNGDECYVLSCGGRVMFLNDDPDKMPRERIKELCGGGGGNTYSTTIDVDLKGLRIERRDDGVMEGFDL